MIIEVQSLKPYRDVSRLV